MPSLAANRPFPQISESAAHRIVARVDASAPRLRGWRRFIYLLFVYMTFEGLLRRSFPLYNLEILLIKDAALLAFYAYFALCVYPAMPKWPMRDKTLIFLGAAFALVNGIGVVRAGPNSIIPVIIGFRANFWYVPLFFIGRRYFTSFRQIRQFWLRLAWLLIPVAAVAVWQVLFGQFGANALPTGTVSAEAWAANGAGSLRNNVDGTMIATVASTFFGARLSAFAAMWILIAAVLCITDQTKALFRGPYLLAVFGCALVGLFLSVNRTAVAVTAGCAVFLLAANWNRHALRFLGRLLLVAVIAAFTAGIYRVSIQSDAVESRFNALTSFFSGLWDAPSADVRAGSRYSVVGSDLVHGIELSVAEVGPFGAGLGLITQGALYIDSDLQQPFEVQRSPDAQADSQWVRLVIELGIPGLVLYLAIALRLLWRATREALRARQRSWADGLTAALAPALLLLYLGFAHKHAGFAIDPMLQCYVYFTLGATLGVATRRSVRPHALHEKR